MMRYALTLALTLGLTTPALAGPPRITVELLRDARGFLLVRTLHHGTFAPMPLSGTAEGLVDGRRVSVPLRFEAGDSAYLFVVPRTWGEAGVWVLALASDLESHGRAGAMVTIGRSGAPLVRYPHDATGATRPATPREIEAALRALASGQQPPSLATTGWFRILAPVVGAGLALAAGVAFTAKVVTLGLRRLRGPAIAAA